MNNKKNSLLQITICLSYFFVFWNLAIFSKFTIKKDIVSIFLKTIVLDITYIVIVILTIKNYRHKMKLNNIKNYFKENRWFALFIVLFVLSLYSILDIWLMGDGAIYYSQVIINRSWNFKNIFDLKMVGHPTCFYTMWLLIGEYIIPRSAVGVRVILIFLAAVTVCMFYGILKKIYKDNNNTNLILYVAIFAFHPGFWGMLAEINTDFAVLVFFVWVIYFHINKQYILMYFSAIMLCFSKETGVMILAFYTFGCLCVNVFGSLKEGLRGIVTKVFSVDMISIYLAAILWLLEWIIGSRGATWGGGADGLTSKGTGISGIKLDTFNKCIEYMSHKLKELFVLNNGYIFIFFLIIAVIVFVFTQRKLYVNIKYLNIIVGIYIAFIGFLNFNLYFVTWPNYRYLLPIILFSTFSASFFILGYVRKSSVQRCIIIVVLFFVVLSNFMADPISKHVFDTVSMGNGDMISTNLFYIKDLDNKILAKKNENITYEYAYDDEGIYNREYAYRGKCINSILKKIKYDSNTIIIFPYIIGSKSFYYGRKEGFESERLYVNKSNLKLSLNYLDCDLSNSINWMPFNAIYLMPDEKVDMKRLYGYERIYYVYPLITGKNKIDYKMQLDGIKSKKSFKMTRCTTSFKVLQLK